jgi:hypothetical protein
MAADRGSPQDSAAPKAQHEARVQEALSGVTQRIEAITAAAERSAAETRARAAAEADDLMQRSRREAEHVASERMELAERRAVERGQALERRMVAREDAAADAVRRTELAIERMGAAMALIRDQFEAVAAELRAAASEVQRSKLAASGRVEEARPAGPTSTRSADETEAFEFPRASPTEARARTRRRRAS